MKTNNVSSIHTSCVQCHGCVNVCPKKCISFRNDTFGFRYPLIDDKLCLGCGACLKKCPVAKEIPTSSPMAVFYGHSNNHFQRMRSSSGGFFGLIADEIAHEQGIVVATIFDSQNDECRYASSDEKTILEMMGSKYVESDMSGVEDLISEALKKNKKVLFVGTPCHVYAIKQIFDNPNLFTCDFVCHGVPSPAFLKERIHNLEHLGGPIKEVFFRFKDGIHTSLTVCYSFQNGKSKRVIFSDDPFYYSFQKNYILRDSCYHCRFTQSHFSDITLSDFWGAEKENHDLSADINKGISLVYVNSPEGALMVKSISNKASLTAISRIKYSTSESRTEMDENKKSLFTFFYEKKFHSFQKTAYYLFFRKIATKNAIKKILRRPLQ